MCKHGTGGGGGEGVGEGEGGGGSQFGRIQSVQAAEAKRWAGARERAVVDMQWEQARVVSGPKLEGRAGISTPQAAVIPVDT